MLADSGLYMVTLREMSGDGVDAGRALGNALPLRIVSTGSVLLAAAAVAWLTPYDPPVKWGTLIGAAIYTCLQTSDFLIAAFQSALKQARNAIAEVTGAVVTLAAVSALAARLMLGRCRCSVRRWWVLRSRWVFPSDWCGDWCRSG